MGIETRYTATITKTCDGCGERWEAKQSFLSVASVLSFGGPIEAAGWQIRIAPSGKAHLLCEKCVEHSNGNHQA